MTISPPTGHGTELPEHENLDLTRRRFARRRLVRRFVALRPLLLTLLGIALIVGLAWLVWFSDRLAVEKVKITGNALVSDAQVRKQAEVPMGRPLARVDTAAIQARLQDVVQFSDVDVSRCWPDAVCIEVTERRAVAVVDREGVLRGLDPTGVLFRSYQHRPVDLPLVRARATVSVDALRQAAEIVTALPTSLTSRTRSIDVHTVDDIRLTLAGGATVEWGSAERSATKAEVLEALLRVQPDAKAYDVTSPGTPTVR
ncbi:MAG: FtsQ-type POTRA domain-containing protein [Nocardioidaceae bacterium]